MFMLKLYETGESSEEKSHEKAISDHLQMYNLQPIKTKYFSDWNGDKNAYTKVKEYLARENIRSLFLNIK